ncbi:MAG: hypothetical protein WC375_12905, partial [Methanomassiliicoccales archaeon]
NPFSEGDRSCDDLIGIIAPEGCINELSLAKANAPDTSVRQVMQNAIQELSERGFIEHDGDLITRMTERGKRLLELEPVVDALSCRCETDTDP